MSVSTNTSERYCDDSNLDKCLYDDVALAAALAKPVNANTLFGVTLVCGDPIAMKPEMWASFVKCKKDGKKKLDVKTPLKHFEGNGIIGEHEERLSYSLVGRKGDSLLIKTSKSYHFKNFKDAFAFAKRSYLLTNMVNRKKYKMQTMNNGNIPPNWEYLSFYRVN